MNIKVMGVSVSSSCKRIDKKTYPNNTIRGDGQVVVIDFSSDNDIIEACPCFRNNDDSFTYPDSNNSGKWRITNPLPEQEEVGNMNVATNNVYFHLCQMMRVWKNKNSVKMNGLLIDTLVYNFFNIHDEYNDSTYDDYLSLCRDFLGFLADLNKEQKYWFAFGSKQHVYNKNKGKFIDKAQEAFNMLNNLDAESDNVYECLNIIFGEKFPSHSNKKNSLQLSAYDLKAPGEEFIDLDYRYPIRITNSLKIECIATSPKKIVKYLTKTKAIGKGCDLKFYIEDTNAYGEYKVFWKVRNRGRIEKISRCFEVKLERVNQ